MNHFERKNDGVIIRTKKQTQHRVQDGVNIIMPVEHHELPVTQEIHHHHQDFDFDHHGSDRNYKSWHDGNITIVETHKYYESDSDVTPVQRRVQRSTSHEERDNQLMIDNRRLREELEEHLRHRETSKHDTESILHKLDQLTKERERIDKDHDTAIKELKKRVKDLEGIRSDLESKLENHDKHKDGNLQTLQHKIETMQVELDSRSKQIDHMTIEHQHVITSLHHQTDDRDTHRFAEMSAEIEAMKKSHIPMHREAELLEKIRKLSAALMEKEAEINRLHIEPTTTIRKHATTESCKNCLSLQDRVHQQESLISELQREIGSFKTTTTNDMRCTCGDLGSTKTTITDNQFGLSTGCPKCLLEESSRRLPSVSHTTLNVSGNSDVQAQLDEASRNLNASKSRIRQLEQWLNGRYNTGGCCDVETKLYSNKSRMYDQMTPLLPSLDYHNHRRVHYASKAATNLTGNLTGLITDRHANCSSNCIHHIRKHLGGRIA